MLSARKLVPKFSDFVFSKCLNLSYCTSTTNNSFVTVAKQKQLFLIGINRPEKRNCVNSETAKQLINAFDEFENDNESLVAILHGHGGNFCSGYDLQEVAEGKIIEIPPTLKDRPMGPTYRLLKKPVVAAISGYAVAGGFELALWCDLRVVEDTAIMGVFCRRFGVPLVDGGTVRLPRLIGLSRALDLILTGRGINAKEAHEIGLATKIVACGTSLGNAVSLANSLCKFPQECLKMDRHSAYNSVFDSKSMEDALKFEYENAKHVLAQESLKGAESFLRGIGSHGKFHLDAEPTKEWKSQKKEL